MAKYIGIDLGTTNSVVAAVDGTTARVLDNREAKSQTRSVVGLYTPRGKSAAGKSEILVGDPALDNWEMAAADTIISVKRLMGRSFSDPEVQRVTKGYQYRIVEPTNGTKDSLRVLMGGKEYSPIDISTLILAKLKADAEFRLGHPVTHAVITVPAYFTDVQREATRTAGGRAGLTVIQLLDEPTAAAIAFGIDPAADGAPKTILVYDLGGGTFDLSILITDGGTFQPLALGGDMWLGGDNFDDVLIAHALEHVRSEFDIDPTKDKKKHARFLVALKRAAMAVKERLSNTQSARLVVSSLLKTADDDAVDVDVEVTRGEYERMIAPLIARSVVLTVRTIAKSGRLTKALHTRATALVERLVGTADSLRAELAGQPVHDQSDEPIDHVLMAGNSTCVPAVQQAMEELFGPDRVLRKAHPKLVVALGAATLANWVGERVVCQAHPGGPAKPVCGNVNPTEAVACEKCGTPLARAAADGTPTADEPYLAGNIAPFAYGVQGAGDTYTVFVNAGDPYETPDQLRKTQVSETRVPNQRMVRMPVYGGDHADTASKNEKQGEALAVLPPGLPRGAKVFVCIWLDRDGVFKLTAHLESGVNLNARITRDTDLAAVEAIEKVERMYFEKARHADPDELGGFDAARERAYDRMRQGDYDGAAREAAKGVSELETVGDPRRNLAAKHEGVVGFAEFVLRKYDWILKADPDGQARLENLIADVTDAARRNDPALAKRVEALVAELESLPDLIHAFLGMKSAIAARIQPLDPVAARTLEAELERTEDRCQRQFADIERLPRGQQATAARRLAETVGQELEAFHGKLQQALTACASARTQGVPCPKAGCGATVPPGVVYCPKCGEDLRLLDFGKGKRKR